LSTVATLGDLSGFCGCTRAARSAWWLLSGRSVIGSIHAPRRIVAPGCRRRILTQIHHQPHPGPSPPGRNGRLCFPVTGQPPGGGISLSRLVASFIQFFQLLSN